MANMKDVARIAGVSLGTVSRYINGKSVKEKNCKEIEAAIKEIGFKVNHIARGLKTNKTNTIGVLVPDIFNPHAQGIVKHVEKHLFKYGYNIFTCDTWNNIELEKAKVELLIQRQVDGIIIYPCSGNLSHITELLEYNIPVVVVDMGVKDLICDEILTDNINATYKAVEYLFSRNHRRIGIINGNVEYFTSGERFEGYKRVHQDYSVSIDEKLVKNISYSKEDSYKSTIELLELKDRPTAIVTCNYQTTIGVMEALLDYGVKVPEDISVIGFDDVELLLVTRPKVSVIAQPLDKIGKMAADIIIKRINGDMEGYPSVNRLATELILRESTGSKK